MFISHETKCVNMDNIDTMEVAHRDLYNDYIIEIRKNNSIVLCIYSSGHMTFEETKFVYESILGAMNGSYYIPALKKWRNKPEEAFNAVKIDEKDVDRCLELYHNEFEKKDSQ